MPKLDDTHLPSRIAKRLDDLKAGKDVSARDIRALLNEQQRKDMDAAWAHQQALRSQKRARSKEEEIELGWKNKRDVHIETYESALQEAEKIELDAHNKRLNDSQVREARIFLDTYFAALDEGRPTFQAESMARNELKRAGLLAVDQPRFSERDREIQDLEAALIQAAIDQMTPEERLQYELSQEHDKAVEDRSKKRPK